MTSVQGRAAQQTALLDSASSSPAEVVNEVESMENALLEGSFREALTLANRFLLSNRCRFLLHRHRRSSFSKKSNNCFAHGDGHDHPQEDEDANTDNNTTIVRVQTSRLALDGMEERDCHISVCGWSQNDNNEDDAMDPAAAVALQSWYELAKLAEAAATKSNNNNNNTNKQANLMKGHHHLRPFLDTYTTPNGKAMSLELFVVWVQLCRTPALQQVDVATSLTIQVLRMVRRSSEQQSMTAVVGAQEERQMDIDAMSQKACAELVLLLFVDLLPSYHQMKSEQVEQLLECLTSESLSVDEILSSVVGPRRTTSTRNEMDIDDDTILSCKGVIQQCLCFCNTDDGNWPVWLQDSLCECRVKLQAMLREMYHRQQMLEQKRHDDCDRRSTTDLSDKQVPNDSAQQHSTSTRLVLSQDQKLSLTNVRSWKVALVKLLRSLQLRLKASTGSLLQPHQKQRIQMALLTLCLMYGWRRHRHRIAAAGRDAATSVLWNPAKEILEAFGFKV